MFNPTGKHVMIDGRGDPDILANGERLAVLLEDAARKAGAGVRNRFIERFHPLGISVFVVLTESHASIHTYPEDGVYMADIFTCGAVEPLRIAVDIVQVLGDDYHIASMTRGFTAALNAS